MNWRAKSLVQRACAALPGGGESVYYWIQRHAGSLRRAPDPRILLEAAASFEKTLRACGKTIRGQRVLEVGTGRKLDMPAGFFLLGAKSVVTVDLHRYLRPELIEESLEQMREQRSAVRALFAPWTEAAELEAQLDRLCRANSARELIDTIALDYRAPADAAALDLPAGSIDLHVSYTVLEHIPRESISAILREASRLLGPEGAALHHVDLSDHFAHADPSISMINFLRFPEKQWARFNDNQFAYCNRLRVDAYDRIFEAEHEILERETMTDPAAVKLIEEGFPLAPEFRSMPPELLATTVARYVSRARVAAA